MVVTKEQLRKIEKFVFAKAKKQDYNHDKDHIVRTAKLALFLADKERANKEVCYVAALLHDIAKGDEPHEEKGAKVAGEFLRRLNFPNNFVQQVAHAIKCHGWKSIKNAKTIEAKILYDADMLQVVGPYSFCRVLTQITVFENKLPLKEAVKRTKWAQNSRFNLLRTKTAKKIMRADHEFMKEFYKLYDKWDKVRL